MPSLRGLQERAARALPAEFVEDADGWWLRHAPNSAWWVGTVLPHGDDDLPRRVDLAERFYADRGAVTRFQVTPGACSPGLDALLEARGYRRLSMASLQVSPPAQVLDRASGSLRVVLGDSPSPRWFEVWSSAQDHDGEVVGERAMIARVPLPSVYASAMIGDSVVAVGRSVVDTGWAGVFSMATLPSARGRGAAVSVLAALAEWARSRAADGMYLQVAQDNDAALRLYSRAGFSELCRYHYRDSRTEPAGRRSSW